jgi:hypothetical protein
LYATAKGIKKFIGQHSSTSLNWDKVDIYILLRGSLVHNVQGIVKWLALVGTLGGVITVLQCVTNNFKKYIYIYIKLNGLTDIVPKIKIG